MYTTDTEDSLLDEFGRRVEMDPDEKKALEESEYNECLQLAVDANQAVRALGCQL